MSPKVRSILSGFLALILMIGSLQMAVARSAPMPVDEMVLCTTQGAVTVAIDAEGNPTGEMQYCPECAAIAFAFVDVSAPDFSTPAPTSLAIDTPAQSLPVVQAARHCPQARGPPLSV